MNNVCFDEGGFRIPKRHPEEAKRRKLEEVSEAKAQYKALGLTRREAFEQGLAGPPRGSKGKGMQPSRRARAPAGGGPTYAERALAEESRARVLMHVRYIPPCSARRARAQGSGF